MRSSGLSGRWERLAPDETPPHLLVVEDSPTQAEYIRRILSNEGFSVSVASEGRAALRQMTEQHFDLVISDIIMPGLDGYELCRMIREKSTIPVILVTQLYDPEDILRGLASGADGFIIKPFDPLSLIDTVCDMLDWFEEKRVIQEGDRLIAHVGGYSYTIAAEKETILSILLSTYATAVNKNIELQETQDELYAVNEQLQEYVEELRQTNDELQSEMLERRRMEKAVGDAHRKLHLMTDITRNDIRNQLSVIEGYLQLATPESGTVTIDEAMGKIRESGRRIGRIIEFTRDFQNIGSVDPSWQELRSVVDAARMLLDRKGVDIEIDLPEIEIRSDPLLERVFGVVFDNAVLHGETITKIMVSARPDGTNLVISIADDGIGIPQQVKGQVFEQGYGKNTGLGLFLASEILATSGFSIHECGMPGQGALFEIQVPEGHFRFL